MTVRPGSTSAALNEVDAIAETVLGCSGVSGLDAGGWRPVATYLPGRRVAGVRADEKRIVVSVVLGFPVPVPVMEAEVRVALALISAGRLVDVQVVDVAVPTSPRPRTHGQVVSDPAEMRHLRPAPAADRP